MYINQDSGLVFDPANPNERLDAFVAPVIFALRDKGYIPISSCDGHHIDEPMEILFHVALGTTEISQLASDIHSTLRKQQVSELAEEEAEMKERFIALDYYMLSFGCCGRYRSIRFYPRTTALFDSYDLKDVDRGSGHGRVVTPEIYYQWNRAVLSAQLVVAINSLPMCSVSCGPVITKEQLAQVKSGELKQVEPNVSIKTEKGFYSADELDEGESVLKDGVAWVLLPKETLVR